MEIFIIENNDKKKIWICYTMQETWKKNKQIKTGDYYQIKI